MQLKDVMRRKVEVVSPGTRLSDAARQMNASRLTMLPVCEGTRLVGVLTARDLTVRATSGGCDPWTTPVRDVMTRSVIYGRDDQAVLDAAVLMVRHRLSLLPVLDQQGRLVGIISLGDLDRKTLRVA
jgi:CBS domain-containing protein